ncbi:MAG: hypothetical protein ACRDE6_01260 [Candidatus Limnocylindria bacterium]
MRTRGTLVALAAVIVAGCSIVGASDISVLARNDSDDPMVVQVIQGQSDGDPPHGTSRTIAPGAEERLTLAVPGGSWTVTVNGAHLVGSSDAGDRRGELPITLILPDAAEFPHGPYWEAPGGWAETGP